MYVIKIEDNNKTYYIATTITNNGEIFVKDKTTDINKAEIFNSIDELISKNKLFINNKQIDWCDIIFEEIEILKNIKIKKKLENYWTLLVKEMKFYKKTFDDIRKIVVNKKIIEKEEFKKICESKFVKNFRFDHYGNEIILIGEDFILAEKYDDYQNYLIKLELPKEIWKENYKW